MKTASKYFAGFFLWSSAPTKKTPLYDNVLINYNLIAVKTLASNKAII